MDPNSLKQLKVGKSSDKAPIPDKLPQRFLFCAHRQIPGKDDMGRVHLQIVGVHPPERMFEINSDLLQTYWYFLFEVRSQNLLSHLRFPVPGDRLMVTGVSPTQDLVLRNPVHIAPVPVSSVRIVSLNDMRSIAEGR